MQRIRDIRAGLRSIPNALHRDPDFEWRDRGPTRVLWNPSDGIDPESLEAQPSFDEFEPRRSREDLIPIVEVSPEIDQDVSQALLGKAEAEEVASRVLLHGIEALAWYMPFHQDRYQWGCFLSLSGVLALADVLLPLNLEPSRRIQLAIHALLRHETTHFAVEYMAAQWELSVGAACYLPARKNLRDPQLGYIYDEELAANAYMLRGFRYPSDLTRCAGAFDLLRSYTTRMPPGYNRGQDAVEKHKFLDMLMRLANAHVRVLPSPAYMARSGVDLLANYPNTTYFDPRHIPVFLMSDTSSLVISSLVVRFIPSVQRVNEEKSFVKNLSRMSGDIQRAWTETKRKLARSTALPGLDFKPWGGDSDTFSVRVTRSVRAHLRLNRNIPAWTAYEIGQHKDVGHG